jgi:glycosyltransferase involved in cell wall biosynthesis
MSYLKQKNNPLFSVIVANFNNGRFLAEMIHSVKNQTYTNWELVIADDCSTDNSLDILKEFEQDQRIKVVTLSKNTGAGNTFRTAINHASGDIVGMLGADDALQTNALEQMVCAHTEHPSVSLITSLSIGCSATMAPLGPYTYTRLLNPGEELIHHPFVGSFATFKRSAYDKTLGFDAQLKRAVDRDIYLKLDEVGPLFGLNEYLYFYRLHDGGISQGESGTKAYRSAILATCAAYHRRKETGKANISKAQYMNLMTSWFLQEAFLLRWVQKTACNRLLFKGFMHSPKILFRRDYWSIFARNNFIGL